MNQKDSGLTVGELTIAISVLIIAVLTWSTVNQKRERQESHIPKIHANLLSTEVS